MMGCKGVDRMWSAWVFHRRVSGSVLIDGINNAIFLV
jgi:hypothetical protein